MATKICIINGSPKGESSITFQPVKYIEAIFQENEYYVIHASHFIKTIEKDFSSTLEVLKDADIFLFAYPVYTFLVPSQLHRFIELMKASGEDFSSKAFCQISTSKHFYDITAHTFIADNCTDMKIKNLGSLSSDMDDLLNIKGQKNAEQFMDLVLFRYKNNLTAPMFALQHRTEPSEPFPVYKKCFHSEQQRSNHQVCIVCDLKNDDKSLKNMIEDFIAVSPFKTKIVNLREFNFQGGCTGCLNCTISGKCFWKDGFSDLLKYNIHVCDSIIFAFTVDNHSMGSLFKTFDDRQFYNGHRPLTTGKPTGYIVNGKLDSEPNLRTLIEARTEVSGNFLAGIATDTESIESLSKSLLYALDNKIKFPSTFWGEGGMRIFRDLIYIMQGLMEKDHKFYKSNGFYDSLPTKHKFTIMKIKFLGALLKNKTLLKKKPNMLKEGMLLPYEKIINNAQKH